MSNSPHVFHLANATSAIALEEGSKKTANQSNFPILNDMSIAELLLVGKVNPITV